MGLRHPEEKIVSRAKLLKNRISAILCLLTSITKMSWTGFTLNHLMKEFTNSFSLRIPLMMCYSKTKLGSRKMSKNNATIFIWLQLMIQTAQNYSNRQEFLRVFCICFTMQIMNISSTSRDSLLQLSICLLYRKK